MLLQAKVQVKTPKTSSCQEEICPWWLLGVSMVATTFAADTPNFVAGLIREKGVSGNWAWWAFLFTGMLTVFIYAKTLA